MSIEEILKESADLEEANKETLGIKRAYNETPEKSVPVPYSIRYPVEWDYDYSTGGPARTTHRFRIEVRLARGFLPQAEKLARPMIKKWRDLYAQKQGINVATVERCWLEGGTYGIIEAGEEQFMGIIFNVVAKEVETITTGV